jgi:hypothetical protein
MRGPRLLRSWVPKFVEKASKIAWIGHSKLTRCFLSLRPVPVEILNLRPRTEVLGKFLRVFVWSVTFLSHQALSLTSNSSPPEDPSLGRWVLVFMCRSPYREYSHTQYHHRPAHHRHQHPSWLQSEMGRVHKRQDLTKGQGCQV